MAKAERVRLTTPPFVAMFPNLFTPKAGGKDGDGKLKYGVTAFFDPARFSPADKERWAKIRAALDEESMRAFKMPWGKLNPLHYRTGIRKNSDREQPFENFGTRPASDKALFANITSMFKPDVVDIDRNEISREEGNEDLVYPGCLMRATVEVYSFNGEGKGVALSLNNIQVISSDESRWPRQDNRRSGADEFADEEIPEDWIDEAAAEDDDDIY